MAKPNTSCKTTAKHLALPNSRKTIFMLTASLIFGLLSCYNAKASDEPYNAMQLSNTLSLHGLADYRDDHVRNTKFSDTNHVVSYGAGLKYAPTPETSVMLDLSRQIKETSGEFEYKLNVLTIKATYKFK